jgi:hypothetical protein
MPHADKIRVESESPQASKPMSALLDQLADRSLPILYDGASFV